VSRDVGRDSDREGCAVARDGELAAVRPLRSEKGSSAGRRAYRRGRFITSQRSLTSSQERALSQLADEAASRLLSRMTKPMLTVLGERRRRQEPSPALAGPSLQAPSTPMMSG
jgi:hypothetical protein